MHDHLAIYQVVSYVCVYQIHTVYVLLMLHVIDGAIIRTTLFLQAATLSDQTARFNTIFANNCTMLTTKAQLVFYLMFVIDFFLKITYMIFTACLLIITQFVNLLVCRNKMYIVSV